MHFFKKRIGKANLSQSILEYTMVIALVALGIIAMNRYVFRATWAGIKTWEDQVNDSLNEQFGGGECPYGAPLLYDPDTHEAFCKVRGDHCPIGWSPYLNWSETVSTQCCIDNHPLCCSPAVPCHRCRNTASHSWKKPSLPDPHTWTCYRNTVGAREDTQEFACLNRLQYNFPGCNVEFGCATWATITYIGCRKNP